MVTTVLAAAGVILALGVLLLMAASSVLSDVVEVSSARSHRHTCSQHHTIS